MIQGYNTIVFLIWLLDLETAGLVLLHRQGILMIDNCWLVIGMRLFAWLGVRILGNATAVPTLIVIW